jgi:hypothetical protein
MEVSDKLHASAALTPGKQPLVPLDRSVGRTEIRSDVLEKREIYLSVMNRTTILRSSNLSLAFIPAEIPRPL